MGEGAKLSACCIKIATFLDKRATKESEEAFEKLITTDTNLTRAGEKITGRAAYRYIVAQG